MHSDYVLAQATDTERERRRLGLIQSYQDPPTFRYLSGLGLQPGWRCLDAGAGGGSVARWLCEQVGPGGSVLATDLETALLDENRAENMEVRRHDLLHDPLPEAAFDLVHTRLLLIHLPQRVEALRRLVAAARPGGLVVVGDIDFTTFAPAGDDPLLERVHGAFLEAVRPAGWDPGLGPKLPTMLAGAGLQDVAGEGFRSAQPGGGALGLIQAATLGRLRERIVAAGTPDEDVAAAIARLEDPSMLLLGPTIWTVWGRRPG
jgi:SAM-dependent methyltransferase